MLMIFNLKYGYVPLNVLKIILFFRLRLLNSNGKAYNVRLSFLRLF